MQSCTIIDSGVVPCDQYYSVQNLALTKIEEAQISRDLLIRLRVGNRILCFNILEIKNFIEQNETILNTDYGSCQFTQGQIDKINKHLAMADKSPIIKQTPAPKRKIKEIMTPLQQMFISQAKKIKVEAPQYEFTGFFAELPNHFKNDILIALSTVNALQDDPQTLTDLCTSSRAWYQLCKNTTFTWLSPWGKELKVKGIVLLNQLLSLENQTHKDVEMLLELLLDIDILEQKIIEKQNYIQELQQVMPRDEQFIRQQLQEQKQFEKISELKFTLIPILLKAGIPLNTRKRISEYKYNAVLLAAKIGIPEIVNLLLEANANIEDQDEGGNTPLMLAAENGNLQIVKDLIGKGADVSVTNFEGDTALMLAAREGHDKVIELLLQHKIPINDINNSGKTALMLSVEELYPNTVKILLDAGANANIQDDFGMTALMFISQSREYLRDYYRQYYESIRVGNKEEREKLEQEFSSIMDAIKTVAQLLINTPGIQLNAQNESGDTALNIAISDGNNVVAQLLIKAGANVNLPNYPGMTPLMNAAFKNDGILIEMLVKAGANVNTEGPGGLTALDYVDLGRQHQVQKDQIKALLESLGAKTTK